MKSNTSTLRITSGVLKGRKISTPVGATTHPMGSRERLALFNTLTALRGPLTQDIIVLDLYAGSGALGFEALSRGAKKVLFVDNSAAAISVIKQNALSLGMEKSVEIHKSSIPPANSILSCGVSSSISKQPLGDSQCGCLSSPKFDLIFADPPYDDFPPSLAFLANYLKRGGILVLSHPKTADLSSIKGLKLLSTKSYAAANLSFFSL